MSQGTYIPEDQRDSAWWIWNKKFTCRIPYLQSMSTDYIRQFGVMVSGDPVRDKAIVSETITTMLSIAQMVEYFSKGVTVGVVKYEDTKHIYELISNHLQQWRQQLEQGLPIRDAPIDDLVTMDRFANAVYRHARHQFDHQFVDSILARTMMGTMRVNRSNFMLNKPGDVKPTAARQEEDPVSKLPERQSLAEIFRAGRSGVRKTWK